MQVQRDLKVPVHKFQLPRPGLYGQLGMNCDISVMVVCAYCAVQGGLFSAESVSFVRTVFGRCGAGAQGAAKSRIETTSSTAPSHPHNCCLDVTHSFD